MRCSECGESVAGSPERCPFCAAVIAMPAGTSVLLLSAGSQLISVIKAIRESVELGLADAKRLVDGAPSTVATGLSPDAAEAIRSRLASAGAVVELRAAEASAKEGPARVEPPCDVVLTNPGPNLIHAIKLIRESTGLGLLEARKLAESAPVVVRQQVGRTEAESLRALFAQAGVTLEIRDLPSPPAPEPTIACSLFLMNPGSNLIAAIKAIHEIADVGILEAKRLAQSVPVLVKDRLSREKAERLRDLFAEAGATAEIRPAP